MKRYIDKRWYPYLIWLLAVIIYIVVYFHRLAIGAVREEVSRDFGLMNSPQEGSLFTLLGVMYMYAYMLMQIPTGVLADRLGPKKTIVGGTLLAAMGSILFGMSQHMGVAFVARFIVGIGVAVVFVCILKMIADWFPKECFSTMSGITSFVGNMGSLLALSPLVLLTQQIGWRQVFICIGGLSVVLSILCWIFIQEKEGEPVAEQTLVIPLGKVLWNMITNKKFYPPMIIFALTFGATITMTANWGVTMMVDLYGVDKVDATNVISMITIGVAIGSIVIGKISDQMKSCKKPMLWFEGIHLVCWILVTTCMIPFVCLYVVFFILGFTGTSFIVAWGYAKEQYLPRYSGMAMSVINFSGFLGGALVPQVIGLLYDILPKANLYKFWQIALSVLTLFIAIAFINILFVKEN